MPALSVGFWLIWCIGQFSRPQNVEYVKVHVLFMAMSEARNPMDAKRHKRKAKWQKNTIRKTYNALLMYQ